jgi:hypothetical protein
MAKNYQHFILTAFNIDFDINPSRRTFDNAYLEKRFNLFAEICFPSVVSQTNQDFQWLVFFDREIDPQFQAKINEFSQYQNFIPVYTPPRSSNYRIFADVVRSRLPKHLEYVITSNLDNDDALSQDFIELVQNNFHEQKFEFLNFPLGLMLNQYGIFLREYLSSPFLSLVEKNEEILTCRMINHYDLMRLFDQGLPVRHIVTHPMWLQVVQGSNAINNLDINGAIVPKRVLKKHFVLKEDSIKKYLTQKYPDLILSYLHRFIWQNKYKIPLAKRIRNLLNLIDPQISIFYLSVTLKKLKISRAALSYTSAKELCQKHI